MRWISAASATGSRDAMRSRQYHLPGLSGTSAVSGCSRSGSTTSSAGIGPNTPGTAVPLVADDGDVVVISSACAGSSVCSELVAVIAPSHLSLDVGEHPLDDLDVARLAGHGHEVERGRELLH